MVVKHDFLFAKVGGGVDEHQPYTFLLQGK